MAKPVSDQIAAIKAKKEQLSARLNTLAAKAKQEDRKRDTRRKIVVGAAVLTAMESDADLAFQVAKLLRRFVTRDHDRTAVADILGPSPAPQEAAAAES